MGVAATTLTLPPRGIEDAVDEEMGNGSGSGEVGATTEAVDAAEVKRAKERQKRKARKSRWKERKRERMSSTVVESEVEVEYGDDYDPFTASCTSAVLPARLVTAGDGQREYERRLAVAQQTGSVSFRAYCRMLALMEADIEAMDEAGKDWRTAYEARSAVTLKITGSAVSDLQYDEQEYDEYVGASECDDVMIDE